MIALRWLTCRGYRSLAAVEWGSEREPLGDRVVIVGENGVGKSNLFRAVHLATVLAPKSLQDHDGLVQDEVSAAHVGSDGVIDLSLGIDINPVGVRARLGPMPPEETPFSDPVRKHLNQLFDLTGPVRLNMTVQASVHDERRGHLRVKIPAVTIAGVRFVEDGAIVFDGVSDRAPLAKFANVMQALLGGFWRIDCPRQASRTNAAEIPSLLEQYSVETTRGHFFWQDYLHSELANAFAHAERDARAAGRVQALRDTLRSRYGVLGISDGAGDDDHVATRELVLGALPGVDPLAAHAEGYIPARAQGAGFEQLLHIQAAMLLGSASVLAVEELEANLSPRAQATLWDDLGRMQRAGRVGQVLVTSHSPAFLVARGASTGVDVWMARKEGRGTSVSLLRRGDEAGEKALFQHFMPLDDAIFRRFAVEWRSSGETVGDRSVCLLTIGDQRFDPATPPSADSPIWSQEGSTVRLLLGDILAADSKPDILRSLSLEEWVTAERYPIQAMRVEWSAGWSSRDGLQPFQACYRVEWSERTPDGTSTEKDLLLRVEARALASEVDVGAFLRQLDWGVSDLRKKLQALRNKLSGHGG